MPGRLTKDEFIQRVLEDRAEFIPTDELPEPEAFKKSENGKELTSEKPVLDQRSERD